MIVIAGDLLRRITVSALLPQSDARPVDADIDFVLDGQAVRTAAWLAQLGAKPRLFAKVGASDSLGLNKGLKQRGIDSRLIDTAEAPTGTLASVTSSADTTEHYLDLGAAASLASEDVPDDLLDGARWLHLSGYLFYRSGPRAVAQQLIAQAHERGIGVSTDPASAHLLRAASAPAFVEWTRGVDLILPNLDETRVLVGATGPFIDFEALGGLYPHSVVKLASMGAAYVSREQREQVAASRVDVQDRTGVGDAFVAGFLAAWVAGSDPKTALNQGNLAAQNCLQTAGALP